LSADFNNKQCAFFFTGPAKLVKILYLMAGKIIIDTERCKGCGLCITVCPKGGIVISKKSNKNGYFPAEAIDSDCTGCCFCAIVCPEAVIKVHRDNNVTTVPSGKVKPNLIKEGLTG